MTTVDSTTEQLLKHALSEDIGTGDLTTLATVPPRARGTATLTAKEAGILCGCSIFDRVFQLTSGRMTIRWLRVDGNELSRNEKCAELQGHLSTMLTGERTALNLLQRMSGVATLTRKFVDMVKGTDAKIIDTRKTTPLWRNLEKYAVQTGGGSNHRRGLYDMYLIKENHIAAAGGIRNAIRRVNDYQKLHHSKIAIEVEVSKLEQIHEVLEDSVDRIMLDNMTPSMMKSAVKLINGRCEIEASGGINLKNVREVAETGVDFISIGALTHSAPSLDFSLIIEDY